MKNIINYTAALFLTIGLSGGVVGVHSIADAQARDGNISVDRQDAREAQKEAKQQHFEKMKRQGHERARRAREAREKTFGHKLNKAYGKARQWVKPKEPKKPKFIERKGVPGGRKG